MEFCNINYFAVLVSGLAAYALGAIWYTFLFGKIWQKEVGISSESVNKSVMMKTMVGSFVLMMIMCFGLAILIQGHPDSDVGAISGLYHGLLVGILFSSTTMGINYLYQLKSFKLWLIDSSYQVTFLGVAGLILGAWH